MNNCTYPWTGMVIDPSGDIKLCCVQSDKNRLLSHHISKIDNLIDYFNGDSYEAVRTEFKEKGWYNIPACDGCKIPFDAGRLPTAHWSQSFNPSLNKLQYLEFTTSNVCNQSCVMCSSKFSNQWVKIEHMFGITNPGKTYILTNEDIDKICESLSDLEELQIKGGEPFADIRNYKIIKKLFEVNDKCKVHIITNGSLIPKKYMDMIFKNPKRFQISASIDAIGKRYEWIRGGPWKQTNEMLQKLYYETGVKVDLVPCLSAYNTSSTSALNNYAKESEWVIYNAKYYTNHVCWPKWCDAQNVFTQEQINLIDDLPFPLISNFNSYTYKTFLHNTNTMNSIRGFDMDIWNDMG